MITDFVVFVSGNEKLTPDELQKDIFRASSSSGSLANFTLENIVIESQQSQRTDETEDTEAPAIIELWKIITFGGLLVVFVLLVFILGLLVSTCRVSDNFFYCQGQRCLIAARRVHRKPSYLL